MENLDKKLNKNLVLLLLGRSVSDIGASIQMIVMPLFIIDLGGSAATVGLYSFLSLATVLVYPFAGVLGDRWNRKTIMVSTDLASAGVLLLLFLCSHFDLLNLPLLLLAQVLITALNGLFDPATKGMVPQIVARSQLTKVNAGISALRTASVLLGSAIGSILYAGVGVTALFFLNSLSFFLSACSEVFISYRHTAREGNAKTAGLFSDLMVGVRFILHNQAIGRLCVYFLVTYAFIQPIFNVVVPVFFRGSLRYSDMQYGSLQMVVIMGALLGSVLVSALFGRRVQLKQSLSVGCGLMVCILGVLTALSTPASIRLLGNGTTAFFVLFATVLCLLSAVLMLIHIPVQTYIQTATPNEYMSRVFSIVGMITKGGMPLGALIYGLVLEKIPVHWAMALTTLLIMLISASFITALSKTQLKIK